MTTEKSTSNDPTSSTPIEGVLVEANNFTHWLYGNRKVVAYLVTVTTTIALSVTGHLNELTANTLTWAHGIFVFGNVGEWFVKRNKE